MSDASDDPLSRELQAARQATEPLTLPPAFRARLGERLVSAESRLGRWHGLAWGLRRWALVAGVAAAFGVWTYQRAEAQRVRWVLLTFGAEAGSP